jgi:hypothetical protein
VAKSTAAAAPAASSPGEIAADKAHHQVQVEESQEEQVMPRPPLDQKVVERRQPSRSRYLQRDLGQQAHRLVEDRL